MIKFWTVFLSSPPIGGHESNTGADMMKINSIKKEWKKNLSKKGRSDEGY